MSWDPINLSDERYAVPSEPPKTCGLLYLGKRHAISGPPESTKTLLAAIFGLEHMRAGHGQFAIADFEMDPPSFRCLLEDIGATPEEVARVVYVNPDGPPDEPDVERLSAAGVTLVFIDAAAGAYVASGLDDNKREDAERFGLLWINPLWRRGITTVLVDHVTKNADTRGRYAIGSERKLGAVDVHLGLEVVKPLHRGADGLIRIHTHKDRPGHLPRPYATEIELHSGQDKNEITWTFQGAAATTTSAGGFRPTVLMERVSGYLARQSEGVSRNDICRDVTGKRSGVLRAIDVLIEEGHAAAAGKRISHLNRYPVPEVVPGGSRNQETDRFPGSLPLQGGTGTGTTTNGTAGTQDEVERLYAIGQEHGLT